MSDEWDEWEKAKEEFIKHVDLEINGYELRLSCRACPEQYDVYKDGKEVAYFRLRHGWFYVSTPTCNDHIIYEASPKGDGIFEEDERMKYLTEAIEAVDKERRENEQKSS